MLQGVPLVLELTGLGLCTALYQLFLHLSSRYIPDKMLRSKSTSILLYLTLLILVLLPCIHPINMVRATLIMGYFIMISMMMFYSKCSTNTCDAWNCNFYFVCKPLMLNQCRHLMMNPFENLLSDHIRTIKCYIHHGLYVRLDVEIYMKSIMMSSSTWDPHF